MGKSTGQGEGRGEEGCCSLRGIRLVDDGPRWKGVRGQCVVDGDRDPAGGQGPTLDQLADVSLEGEVTPLMLHHVDPIHPLQTQGNMSRGQRLCCLRYPLPEEGPTLSQMEERCSNGAHEATLSPTHGT